MKTFIEWLQIENAPNIKDLFTNIGSGYKDAQRQKNIEFAKRIINGESPETVLQGFKPNGAWWQAVMREVEILRQPQQNQPQQNQPQQISLSTFANKIGDITWHQLYDTFTKYAKFNDPSIQQLGKALYQSAQSGDMRSLMPFKQKYLGGQKI